MNIRHMLLTLFTVLAAGSLHAQNYSVINITEIAGKETSVSWKFAFQRRLELIIKGRFISEQAIGLFDRIITPAEIPSDPESAADMIGYMLKETEKQLRKGVPVQKTVMETRRLLSMYLKASEPPQFAKQGSRKNVLEDNIHKQKGNTSSANPAETGPVSDLGQGSGNQGGRRE